MNTTAKVRLTKPQQQTVQRGGDVCPDPTPARAAVRLNGPSVVTSRTAVTLESRAVMAEDTPVDPCDVSVAWTTQEPMPRAEMVSC